HGFSRRKRVNTMSGENPKVLLVDDDKDLLQLIAMRLSAAGYNVNAVESGEAALASLAVSRPQVVVTDLRMQGMDGMALFDAMHRDSPSLPVVILTAHGTIPEAVSATRRGVFSFLTKPFEPKVLLDTVAEAMRLSLQVKLLRALEERKIRPVGSHESHDIDVRVISATHRKLEELIASGQFREDLYYRLNVVKLYIPSLAERREDIPLLANHSLTKLAERYRRGRLQFAPEAMEILVSAPWPGNVRQLLNVVEQAVALAATEVIPESLVRQALDVADTALTPLDEA